MIRPGYTLPSPASRKLALSLPAMPKTSEKMKATRRCDPSAEMHVMYSIDNDQMHDVAHGACFSVLQVLCAPGYVVLRCFE